MNFHMFYKYDMLPVWFDTSSAPEHHWVPLHRILAEYHAAIHNLSLDDVFKQMEAKSSFEHQILADNYHIVTNYFHTRDINCKNTVLKELYDWSGSNLMGRVV